MERDARQPAAAAPLVVVLVVLVAPVVPVVLVRCFGRLTGAGPSPVVRGASGGRPDRGRTTGPRTHRGGRHGRQPDRGPGDRPVPRRHAPGPRGLPPAA